jgi:hypothetical protein
MVGGEHSKHGMGRDALDEKSGKSGGWSGVARGRFADDLIFRDAIELTADGAGEKVIGDYPKIPRLCERCEAVYGVLDHGSFAVERQNLLGSRFAAAWPEAGSAAAGEDDGSEIDLQNGLPLDLYPI